MVPLTALTLRLACREPFDGGALLAFLAARAIPGVEEVTGNRYARTIRSPGGPGLVELTLPAPASGRAHVVRLSELPGIGPWTVAYIRMRALGDRDAFPGTDLGLRRALADLGCQASRADRWRPWRAYAAVHLWTWHAASRR